MECWNNCITYAAHRTQSRARPSLFRGIDKDARAGRLASLLGVSAEAALERILLLVAGHRHADRPSGRLLRRELVLARVIASARARARREHEARAGAVAREVVQHALEDGGEQQADGAHDEHGDGREVLHEHQDDEQVERAAEQVHHRSARCEQRLTGQQC